MEYYLALKRKEILQQECTVKTCQFKQDGHKKTNTI